MLPYDTRKEDLRSQIFTNCDLPLLRIRNPVEFKLFIIVTNIIVTSHTKRTNDVHSMLCDANQRFVLLRNRVDVRTKARRLNKNQSLPTSCRVLFWCFRCAHVLPDIVLVPTSFRQLFLFCVCQIVIAPTPSPTARKGSSPFKCIIKCLSKCLINKDKTSNVYLLEYKPAGVNTHLYTIECN